MMFFAALFDRPYLMDLGSTNGTFINVSPPVILLLLIRYTSRISNNIFYPVNIYVLIFFQENRIEPSRYYELFEKDTIKFGNSRYDQLKKASLFCLFVYCSMYMYLWYVMT